MKRRAIREEPKKKRKQQTYAEIRKVLENKAKENVVYDKEMFVKNGLSKRKYGKCKHCDSLLFLPGMVYCSDECKRISEIYAAHCRRHGGFMAAFGRANPNEGNCSDVLYHVDELFAGMAEEWKLA